MGNRDRTELIERVFFWGNGFNKIFQDWNQIMSDVKKSKYNKKFKSLKFYVNTTIINYSQRIE